MKRIAYGKILAAAGNGSDSDGIYIGEIIAVGEPGVLWEFKLLKKINMPTAIAFRESMSGVCNGTIYIGNSSGVFSGQLCDKTVNTLTQLSGPSNPWGRCSALQFSFDGTFWAGGTFHDKVAFKIQDTALLLRGAAELTKVKPLDVLSMVNYSTLNDSLLAIATYDSGIHLYKGNHLQWTVESPEKNEPVVAIAPFQKSSISGGWQPLVAASYSRVYLQCLPESERTWVSLGTPPSAELRCLAQAQDGVLWLGTSKGIYKYESSTGTQIHSSQEPKPLEMKLIQTDHSSAELSFNDEFKGNCRVYVFDMRGRCIREFESIGNTLSISDISTGTYMYRVYRNNLPVAEGRFVLR
jgi:outer membrane protein assembly factor BamB